MWRVRLTTTSWVPGIRKAFGKSMFLLLGEFTFWDFVGEEELEAEPEPEIRFFLFETDCQSTKTGWFGSFLKDTLEFALANCRRPFWVLLLRLLGSSS